VLNPDEQLEADRNLRRKKLRTLLYALAVAAYFAVRLWSRSASPDDAPSEPPPPFAAYWPFFVAGAVLIPILSYATRAFTFRFDGPIRYGLRLRLTYSSFAVVICAVLGLTPLGVSLPVQLVTVVPFIAFLWPLVERRALLARLQARGVTPEQLSQSTLVTLEDADGSFPRRPQDRVEAGLVWVEGGELRFVGDELDLRLAQRQGTLRREPIAGTLTSLLGHKGIVLASPVLDALQTPPAKPLRAEVRPHGFDLPWVLRDETERLWTTLQTWPSA
jgi:hypothetical protein